MSTMPYLPRTPTDGELREYIQICETIKDLEKRKEEIKKVIIERGPFCSKNYVCSVSDQTRTGLAGLAEVEKALGRDILNYHNLIRVSTFKVVKVNWIRDFEGILKST